MIRRLSFAALFALALLPPSGLAVHGDEDHQDPLSLEAWASPIGCVRRERLAGIERISCSWVIRRAGVVREIQLHSLQNGGQEGGERGAGEEEAEEGGGAAAPFSRSHSALNAFPSPDDLRVGVTIDGELDGPFGEDPLLAPLGGWSERGEMLFAVAADAPRVAASMEMRLLLFDAQSLPVGGATEPACEGQPVVVVGRDGATESMGGGTEGADCKVDKPKSNLQVDKSKLSASEPPAPEKSGGGLDTWRRLHQRRNGCEQAPPTAAAEEPRTSGREEPRRDESEESRTSGRTRGRDAPRTRQVPVGTEEPHTRVREEPRTRVALGEEPRTRVWSMPRECGDLRPYLGFPPVESFSARPTVLLSWFPLFDAFGFDRNETLHCSPRCIFMRMEIGNADAACLDQADAIVLTMAQSPPKTSLKPPSQVWVYYSLESGETFPEMESETFMRPFDVEMSVRKAAKAFRLSFAPAHPEVVRRPLTERKTRGALYLQANCLKWRDEKVASLMAHVQVDALGLCLKNGDYPRGVSSVALMARYKFFIAFENSRFPSFVTERVYNAWIAGAVPVYLGAPDAGNFAPHPKAFIFASDFPDMQALGAYLQYLSGNDTAFAEHLRFKDPSTFLQGPKAEALSEGYLAACNNSLYAPGGEGGSAVPFPRTTEIRDFTDPTFAGMSDLRCQAKRDEAGVLTSDPRSRCFSAHAVRIADHNRLNKLSACRICDAVQAAIKAKRHFPPGGAMVSVHLDGAGGWGKGGGGTEKVEVHVKIFQIPEDGYLLLQIGRGASVETIVHDTPLEQGQYAFRVAEDPKGRYWARAVLVRLDRSIAAEANASYAV